MRRILGVIKFFTSLILVLSFINFCIISVNNYSGTMAIIMIIASFLVFGVYIYYLVSTGLWNFKNNLYSINILLVIGFLLHLCSCIFMIYYVVVFYKSFLLTIIPVIVLFALSISVYDFIKFSQAWKNRKAII